MRRTWLAVALVLLLAGSGASAQSSSGWLVYGNDLARSSSTDTSLSPPSVRPAWYTPISGRVSAQALVAQDVPGPGQRTVYVATSKGVLYALAENGYVRWRVELGQLERVCQQIDGYGVTGTPAIDLGTHAIYVADAFGRIHALDLATGAERPGWPVTVYTDFRRELVWGALTAVDGSLYFGTGSYCDRKMIAKRLPRRHRDGRSLAMGGRAEAPRRRRRSVGVGRARLQRVARLLCTPSPGTRSRAASTAANASGSTRATASGSSSSAPTCACAARAIRVTSIRSTTSTSSARPCVFQHGSCGELAAALNKNGSLYLWRTRRLAAGPVSSLRLSNPTLAAPLLSQAAYSPRTGALYVATPGRLVRVNVDGKCRARVGWSRKVGSGLFNGSPTIAGDTVWLVENANAGSALVAFRATTGRCATRRDSPGRVRRADGGRRPHLRPAVHGRRAGLRARRRRSAGSRAASGSGLNEYRSFADGMHGWASREDGVYATDDGGATWRLAYPRSAVRVALVSPSSGMIAVGDRISRCGCRQVRLWTADGGGTWTRTPQAVGSGFAAAAGTLWWWRGASLYRAAPGRPAPAA